MPDHSYNDRHHTSAAFTNPVATDRGAIIPAGGTVTFTVQNLHGPVPWVVVETARNAYYSQAAGSAMGRLSHQAVGIDVGSDDSKLYVVAVNHGDAYMLQHHAGHLVPSDLWQDMTASIVSRPLRVDKSPSG